MSQARWRIVRIDRLENLYLDYVILGEDAPTDDPDTRILAAITKGRQDPLTLLQRYRTTHERAYYKAHRELINGRRVRTSTNSRNAISSPE
jgi:hypothetical protein